MIDDYLNLIKNKDWLEFFENLAKSKYFSSLFDFLDEEYRTKKIFPKKELLFNAFNLTSFKDVKVVIIGQDPYPNPGQAMGLSFSVPNGIKLPPSLKNIYKEIISEFAYDVELPTSGDLSYLAKQGVLLLNAILTVEEGKPLSHDCKEYHLLLNDILSHLNEKKEPIVFMLWGGEARKYKKLLTNKNHLIIETNHPSPLSANCGGWFNSGCFKTANDFLKNNNIKEIEWLDFDNLPITLF